MVRAILDGRKTVTRRAFKGHQIPQWSPEDPEMGMGDDWHAVGQHHRRYGFMVSGATEADCAKELAKVGACPYGRPGDRLWVREAWQTDAQVNSVTPRDLSHGEPIRYPADWDFRQTGCAMIKPGKIRPSIHMPRWACRILLEITDVPWTHTSVTYYRRGNWQEGPWAFTPCTSGASENSSKAKRSTRSRSA